jgi:hypothetical protein
MWSTLYPPSVNLKIGYRSTRAPESGYVELALRAAQARRMASADCGFWPEPCGLQSAPDVDAFRLK